MSKLLFIVLLAVLNNYSVCDPINKEHSSLRYERIKRQFTANVGATHLQGEGTDFTAEAIARLWRSQSGATEIQGSASYNQHFGAYDGNGRDYRLKLKIVFT
ncbi:uncharacterized protein LOC131691246 [Topomyia yanbarensis]|uniref:uncharacterized protein LOC131691246 n=1 Tax=Topomyia yanbarensis TaxID=2498891 RepID=UPI00273C3016|nr:uncharacterized protein LOC131691246 [Topomyia yanbarensis]